MPSVAQQDPHATVRFAIPKSRAGTVLLVEDDPAVAATLSRMLSAEGYYVDHVGDGTRALEKVMERSFDAVICDLGLPGASGIDVLNVLRAYDPEVPLAIMTGSPSVETAVEAVELGVIDYIVKPASKERFLRVLERAKLARENHIPPSTSEDVEQMLARANAETIRPPAKSGIRPRFEATVEPRSAAPEIRASFDRALASLGVELEPIIDGSTRRLFGLVARAFTPVEGLTTEPMLVAAAEQLGALTDLRRRIREVAARAIADAPSDALLFLDIGPHELADPELYSPTPQIAGVAERIVLGLTSLDDVPDLAARASVLRFVGFRLAIADLDAHHRVGEVAALAPEFVRIDAQLVRNVNATPTHRRIVGALVSMCRSLGAVAVADGVSTAEERDTLLDLGCTFVQGSLTVHRRPVSSPTSRAVTDTASSTSEARAGTSSRS